MSLEVYANRECTQRIDTVLFKDNYIEYIDQNELKKLFNVVTLGEKAQTNIFIKNTGRNDCAIFQLRATDPQLELRIFDSGYLRPMTVFRVLITYTALKAQGLEGEIIIGYHEIYR